MKRSWVWNHATKLGETAVCGLCEGRANNEFSCRGGSTGAIGKHLKIIHQIYPILTPDEMMDPPSPAPSVPPQDPVHVRTSGGVRTDTIRVSTDEGMSNDFLDDTVDTVLAKVMDEDIEDPESDTAEPPPARVRPEAATQLRADSDVALIECVRARSVLYDRGHSRYMDAQLKNNIWNKIAKQLQVSPTTCKSRWTNIRDNYRKALRKRSPSGYKFAKMLSFMDPYYKGQLLPATEDSSNDENEDEEKKKEVPGTITIKIAQSDIEDQESAIDEFEMSSVSVSGNQVPGSSAGSDRQAQAVDAFLAAISPSLKGLSPYHLSKAKAEIFATVHKYELKGIVEGEWGASDINPLS